MFAGGGFFGKERACWLGSCSIVLNIGSMGGACWIWDFSF
jgi:hypothetical protein